MDPEIDTSKMRVPLQAVAKIFEAGLKSKTWDIHGMPHVQSTKGANGRNTVQGGQKGLPKHMAEHCSPYRG